MRQGDTLVNGENKRKVLGICGDVIFVSCIYNFYEAYSCPYTESELTNKGWTVEEKQWEIEKNENYWFIDDDSGICESRWYDDSIDNGRKNLMGIFKTKSEAQARLQEIKKLIA